VKPSIQTSQPPTTFKQPLPKTIVTDTKRQRQTTHDPSIVQVEDKELVEWRKAMKITLAKSTFYFDGVEETFREQATRWITRLGGVRLCLVQLMIECGTILLQECEYRRDFTRTTTFICKDTPYPAILTRKNTITNRPINRHPFKTPSSKNRIV
jgi:hypothetical protein